MENNTANTSDLLVKLTRLEDQVSTLSSQLELSKATISRLHQSLSDRDLQISELQTKLTIAQNSLQKTTIDKIVQCRELIKKGIDGKLVNPILTQIGKYLEVIEGLVAEARAFINSKKEQLHDHINSTSNLMHQGPGHALVYFEKNVVEPVNSIVKKALLSADNNYKIGRDWLEQELVEPGKVLFDRIVYVARELPLDARLVFQTRVLDPALTYIDKLPAVINNLGEDGATKLKQLIAQIGRAIQKCLDYIEEHIKKSSFWDGKHRMQAA